MYIELHARSAFSFLEGASLPEELAGVCQHFHMPAMALLDADGVYGAPRFHLAANKAKIKAHIGAEVSSREFPIFDCRRPNENAVVEQSTINNPQLTISKIDNR